MNILKISLIAFALSATITGFASGKNSNLTISPIIGVEKIQKLLPVPSMKTRTIFGARAIYKLPIASVEAEYTHGQDSAYDSSTITSYKDVGDKLKLGLVGEFSLGSFLSFHLRGGAQGQQSKLTKTVNGLSSTTDVTVKVNPYIGSGLAIHLTQAFSLTADVAAVYVPTKTPGLSDYEIEPTIGFVLNI
jgi:hypothetical protein